MGGFYSTMIVHSCILRVKLFVTMMVSLIIGFFMNIDIFSITNHECGLWLKENDIYRKIYFVETSRMSCRRKNMQKATLFASYSGRKHKVDWVPHLCHCKTCYPNPTKLHHKTLIHHCGDIDSDWAPNFIAFMFVCPFQTYIFIFNVV
jgi:hypothetical protein